MQNLVKIGHMRYQHSQLVNYS